MNRFPREYENGARLLRKLQELKPGEAVDVSRHEMADLDYPGGLGLDRHSAHDKAQWFCSRLPFKCHAELDQVMLRWRFVRAGGDGD